MDSGIGSDVTVTPSESASNAGNQRRDGKRGRQTSPKSAVDITAPPGAVIVPKPGQNKTGKKSEVVSASIPISGWGEIDLSSHRKDIQPTFTVDSNPYSDLVDAVYSSMQSRYSAGAKHIPFALFRHYCFTLWWFRVLWLHKSNGNVLNTEEKNALNILTAGGDWNVPNHIAQYLANMGNFVQGGETFYFRKLQATFGARDTNSSVEHGWLDTPSGIRANDSASFWKYANLPVPGVYTTLVCNEVNFNSATPAARDTLAHVKPEIEGYEALPTRNIVGWRQDDYQAHHSSWRSTYASLGWGAAAIPSDCQTTFHISTSSMKWMSERLATIKDYKVHSSKQLTLSTQGNPIQAYFLGTEDAKGQVDKAPLRCDEAIPDNLNATVDSDLALLSRYGMDSKMLAPSFSFGYRLDRSLVFHKLGNDRRPLYHQRSNFQPWIIYNSNDALVDPPVNLLANMNQTLDYGSGQFMNVRRFATHELNRSIGLDAALVLSDTR